jgi:hypothetical protein
VNPELLIADCRLLIWRGLKTSPHILQSQVAILPARRAGSSDPANQQSAINNQQFEIRAYA